MKPVKFEEAVVHKEKQFDHDSRYHRPDYEYTVPGKERNGFNTWDSSAVRDHCKEKLRQKSIIKKNVPAVTVDEGVSKIMCQVLKQQSALDIDIDIFSENPMDFHYFMAVFNVIVEKKVDNPRGKMARLIKYTTGDAKEMVKKCIQLPAEIGFETAKRLLTERNGDPNRVIAAYSKESKHWPQIKAGDADVYQNFQSFLVKLKNITHLQSWNVLDTPGIRCIVLSKIPGSTRDKWYRNVLAICRRHKREPDVTDVICFVNDETLIVSDPIFSKEAVEQYSDKKPNSRRTKFSSFATKDDGKVHVQEKSPDCIYCSEDHTLYRCNAFINQTLNPRIKSLARKRICYGCLQPMEDGHNAGSCKKRMSCITCKERDPTSLHGYVPKNKKVTGDGNQSQIDQDEVKSNFIADVKCTSALGNQDQR